MNDDVFDGALWLTGAIGRGLARRGGEGVAQVLERLATQDLSAKSFRKPKSRSLPVIRYLAETIAASMMIDSDVAAALAACEEHFHWRQTSAYTDALLGEGFTANYGWCEIIGPRGFFPGDDFLLGLLMLGPDRHYKDHYHPAPELYWPLTGPADWKRDAGGFVERQAGETIWHEPHVVHATKTGAQPLLAIWSWTHETSVPARLVVA